MNSKNRKISFLAFLIATFLIFGQVSTNLAARRVSVEASELAEVTGTSSTISAAATTTTLASSNAPATIANDAATQAPSKTTDTMTTPFLQQQQQQNALATATVSVVATAKTLSSTDAPTKSFLGQDKTPEHVPNEGNGNAVKTQIKYAKERIGDRAAAVATIVETATTTAATIDGKSIGNGGGLVVNAGGANFEEAATEPTQTVTAIATAMKTEEAATTKAANIGGVIATTEAQSPLAKNVKMAERLGRDAADANMLQAKTKTTSFGDKTNELQETKEQLLATTAEAMATVATEHLEQQRQQQATTAKLLLPHNDIHVERQLENGLYRIKLAEIVTDEFNGVSDEQTKPAATTTESTTQIWHEQQQQQKTAKEEKVESAEKVAREEKAAYDKREQQQETATNTAGGNKINIVDLYPMKIEDFNPIIRDSNAKLLRERTIFAKDDVDATEQQQQLMPNEVEMQVESDMDTATDADANAVPAEKANGANSANNALPLAKSSINRELQTDAAAAAAPASISDYTGKLLAEQDGVITEIEQKFRLNEFAATQAASSSNTSSAGNINALTTTTSSKFKDTATPGRFSYRVNHRTLAGHDFIDRRVKKSFDFPLHRAASDAISLPHVDFANTKFNSDTVPPLGNVGSAAGGQSAVPGAAVHPEFSTTKFYNSKELYNEMLQHNKLKLQQKQQQQQQQHVLLARKSPTASSIPSASSRFLGLNNQKFQVARITDTTESNAATELNSSATTTVASIVATTTAAATITTASDNTMPNAKPAKKHQKELKRAKLLLRSLLPTASKLQTAAAKIATATPLASDVKYLASTMSAPVSATTDNMLSAADVASTTVAATAVAGSDAPIAVTVAAVVSTTQPPSTAASPLQRRVTNPTKSSSKPIARPRILSRLQEKINSLECEVQNVPQDSHLWRGNETHELMLPIVIPETCRSAVGCAVPLIISWEGEAEIQSGDVLIVEINDALLTVNDKNNNTNSAPHTTQVYQVTRSGHEHCDVTEGILLDITPLVVDGRKLVTLYDKDLTEGVNLLIVVSELWGAQCVRLKVTTKTDNCGENADCSGKGVCYSNAAMEEYECQCCSGFAGPHCEEIDACTPSPCTNNGICVDLSQGHEGNSYQCLCPYGYTGKNCQYEADPCNSAECMNGGTCVGNSTHFRCDCTPGYAGPLCQHSLNECESSPCVHGICVDQEDGFRCFCQPGFAGELCNFEYNECESNPCQNAGECIDHIGSYECRCTKGYTGSRCQIKVDLCANKPCSEGHRCIDHGNDFNCECPGGQNGPDCNQMARTQCNVNPCTHGGTCWSSGDSFYCACRPGYTGTMCEDEFVVETVISSSEFMVDDTSARNFNEKTFGSSVVLKSPIELHNAYFGAGVLAAAIFIVAIVVTICHCKVNQTYRKFSTRSTTFFPILGFGRRPKSQNKLNKHWLSGKGLASGGNPLRSSSSRGHLPATNGNQYTTTGSTALQQQQQQQQQQQHTGQSGQLHERPFQRHLAMNLENDMYYTVDFSENSQHSPLIQ